MAGQVLAMVKNAEHQLAAVQKLLQKFSANFFQLSLRHLYRKRHSSNNSAHRYSKTTVEDTTALQRGGVAHTSRTKKTPS